MSPEIVALAKVIGSVVTFIVLSYLTFKFSK